MELNLLTVFLLVSVPAEYDLIMMQYSMNQAENIRQAKTNVNIRKTFSCYL